MGFGSSRPATPDGGCAPRTLLLLWRTAGGSTVGEYAVWAASDAACQSRHWRRQGLRVRKGEWWWCALAVCRQCVWDGSERMGGAVVSSLPHANTKSLGGPAASLSSTFHTPERDSEAGAPRLSGLHHPCRATARTVLTVTQPRLRYHKHLHHLIIPIFAMVYTHPTVFGGAADSPPIVHVLTNF